MINKDEISKEMVERYSKRYNDLGRDVKTLGWGTEGQQLYRFQQALEGIRDLCNEDTLLDIGCGFGDFLSFLKARHASFSQYIGWDINPDLIAEAKQIWHQSQEYVKFDVKDISKDTIEENVANYGVMLGLLNVNLQDKGDNYEYSFDLIEKAFKRVKNGLIVDFLSSYRDPNYPKEDFVFYHDPTKMLEFALSLSNNVVLKHDYAPIPQKEFMLFIYK